jgi:hypothetical protein
MTFYRNADGSADWWRIPLRYKWGTSTKSAENAFQKVYQEADIDWAKNLHLRKSGMDKGGTAGLSEEAVSTMSKHSRDKIKQYVPELQCDVMRVMAGFQTKEEYYVPRSLLNLPWEQEQIVSAVFPQYKTWVQQYLSPDGDHSKAAKNFLEELLPFLAIVALQDGIYWIKEYPNNSASIILKNTFPNYEAWASQARKAVIQQQAELEESRISSMDAATQASYLLLRRDINRIENGIQQEREDNRQTFHLMEQELKETRMERDTYRTLLQQSNHQSVSDTTTGATTGTHAGAFPIPIAPRVSPTHRRPIQVPALVALRSSERLPEIPSDLPKTMCEVLAQHQQANLATFDLAVKKGWPASLKIRFSKRSYLYRKIRERAQRYSGSTEQERMQSAAMAMDAEKPVKMSMNQYFNLLKTKDPTTKSRSKRNFDEI